MNTLHCIKFAIDCKKANMSKSFNSANMFESLTTSHFFNELLKMLSLFAGTKLACEGSSKLRHFYILPLSLAKEFLVQNSPMNIVSTTHKTST